MNKNQLLSRVGLVGVSLLLVMAMLAIALPQKAMAAVKSDQLELIFGGADISK